MHSTPCFDANCALRGLVGTHGNATDPRAVRRLIARFGVGSIHIVDGRPLFHPKLIRFDRNGTTSQLIGRARDDTKEAHASRGELTKATRVCVTDRSINLSTSPADGFPIPRCACVRPVIRQASLPNEPERVPLAVLRHSRGPAFPPLKARKLDNTATLATQIQTLQLGRNPVQIYCRVPNGSRLRVSIFPRSLFPSSKTRQQLLQ